MGDSGPAEDQAGGVPGTREDLAAALIACRDRLRARIVRQARRAGNPLDVDDILSSVLRRLDMAMLRGLVRASSEREFWGLVAAATDNLVLDRLRQVRREGRLLAAAESVIQARFKRCRDNGEAAAHLHEILMSLDDDADRELMCARLWGESYRELAARLGRSEGALRQRWVVVCQRLRRDFGAGDGETGRRGDGGILLDDANWRRV